MWSTLNPVINGVKASSELRKKYLKEFEIRKVQEQAARQKEMEEIQRLKSIRLSKKRESAIEGVKRDLLQKESARSKRKERLITKRAQEEEKEIVMDGIRARVAEMLNASSLGDSTSSTVIPSMSGGGKPTSSGTGWITSTSNLDSTIPLSLFEGEGKAVGEVNYIGAEDWRYEVDTDRKRRSFPEIVEEWRKIMEWENEEGE
eukprot:CAMPEP_0182514236 /NCGR_PEP_ID=MMETSP1321-20130603/35383_1 /TAXON_ID=91990 /ORGANISM="Bolidomonas sp., Strain RCC1657" /LENGTH=202 /DNA_ID=CAMNT_0024721389 /DNA_START=227 /DNA_END=831 /DNA_ORIENTATION=+